jgi:hypothetical protein
VGGLPLFAAEKRPIPQAEPEELKAVAALLPEKPAGLGKPVSDRAFWAEFGAAAGGADIVKRAEPLLKTPGSPPTEEDWRGTMEKARRLEVRDAVFNKKLNSVRDNFNLALIAECVEGRGRFLPLIEGYIAAFGKTRTFVVPQHDKDGHTLGGGRYVELGSSPLMAALGMSCYLLGDRLSPESAATARRIVDEWAVKPMLESIEKGSPATGMGWMTSSGNPNPVCMTYCLTAALTTVEPRETRAKILLAAAACGRKYIDGYESDGYCGEGMEYWRYGFTHYLHLAKIISDASGGTIDMAAGEKFRAAARFGACFEMAPGVYPMFSDTMPQAVVSPLIKAILAVRFNLDFYSLPAAADFHYRQSGNVVTSVIWFDTLKALRAKGNSPFAAPPPQPLWSYFKDSGVLVSRSAPDDSVPLSFAIKAGHNAELHNHNDVGSFDAALGSAHIVGDCGAAEYEAMNPDPYSVDLRGSQGHPVPLVDGKTQSPGRGYCGVFRDVKLYASESSAVIDLSKAYSAEKLKSLLRTFSHDRAARKIVVTDTVELSQPGQFGGALPSYQPISDLGGGVFRFGRSPSALLVTVSSPDGPLVFKVSPVNCLRRRGDERASKLDYSLKEPVEKARINITIEPEKNKI